ncbi:MAG: DUF308 domain-containing protein [Candidatus Promineifilaceae bacterium]|nr:DUF308 domain-containing protein [Candidatus Promineifilaceae bacterium]
MSDSDAFAMETKSMPWWLILIEGISALIIGVLLFTSTVQTMTVLVVFLGLYWLIKGIFDLISMFVDHSMWGWKLIIGIIGILAGVVILRNPLMSTFAVPAIFTWVLGFYAILAGIIMLIQAFKGGGWGIGIMGVIGMLIGVFLLGNTLLGAQLVIYLSAAVLVVGGIAAIVFAFRARSS